MKLPLYQVDAFAEASFQGNPAAVCPLETWIPDEVMQAVAEENNLAETAFFVPQDHGFDLRWFTPTKEVDLCGHATLASAYVLFEKMGYQKPDITFFSKSGKLVVSKYDPLLTLDFPAQPAGPCTVAEDLLQGLGITPVEVFKAMDYMAVFKTQEEVESVQPNFSYLKKLDLRGVIVTAPGKSCDFVSRFFAPNFGILEDPVTGSAHCTLAPYWSEKLGKKSLQAIQLSSRKGHLHCELQEDRVLISGKARLYLEGTIYL